MIEMSTHFSQLLWKVFLSLFVRTLEAYKNYNKIRVKRVKYTIPYFIESFE